MSNIVTTENLYRVYCIPTKSYEYAWGTIIPKECPKDSNHAIDTGNIEVVDTRLIQQDGILIREEFVPTQGYYQSLGFEIEIDGNVNSVTHKQLIWPYATTILNGWFISGKDNLGDKVDAYVGTDKIIGAIQAPVSVDDNIITVSSTVMENTAIGFGLKITDGVNINDLGRVINTNMANSTVTVETSATNNFSPLSPTYVQQTVRIIDNMYINKEGNTFSFARKKAGGKHLPANIPLDIYYTNRTGNVKTFTFNVEYIY